MNIFWRSIVLTILTGLVLAGVLLVSTEVLTHENDLVQALVITLIISVLLAVSTIGHWEDVGVYVVTLTTEILIVPIFFLVIICTQILTLVFR